MKKNQNIIPVILAGGSGTRLWPLSSQNLPKQFLSILGKETLLQETISRFLKINPKELFILGNSNHLEVLKKNLPDTQSDLSIILEPIKRNTAPAITISALKANDEDYLVVAPSDHYMPNPDFLMDGVKQARELTGDGSIILFGIKPTYPSQSYGYIQKGSKIGNLYEVKSFTEKPDKKTADSYIKSKEYLWNSGIFLFKARDFLSEMEKFNPLMLKLCRKAINNSILNQGATHIAKEDYEDLENISIDYALLEKTRSLKVLEMETTWGDLGTWQSIKDHSFKDLNDNTLIGKIQIDHVTNSYINSDKKDVIVNGLSDLLVVDRGNQLLISGLNTVSNIEDQIKTSEDSIRQSDYTIRPWGRFKTLIKDDNYHVKQLIVNRKGQLSLQKHKHRAEHWTITTGKALVVKGEKEIELTKDSSIKIEKGEIHRITNIGNEELHIIEVQIGDYFGEDDIQRLEDIYDRG